MSGDSKAEKLHFDGGKLNQVSSEDLGAERQIETVMSARRDYYRLCVCATWWLPAVTIIKCRTRMFVHALWQQPPIIRVNEQARTHTYDSNRRPGRHSEIKRSQRQVYEIVCWKVIIIITQQGCWCKRTQLWFEETLKKQSHWGNLCHISHQREIENASTRVSTRDLLSIYTSRF